MSITRTAIVDDDGSGTLGTVLNNAWKQEIYDQIDAADAALATAIGTGLPSSLTNHALVLGRGASPLAAAGTGAAGDIMASLGSSADPAFYTPFAAAAYRTTAQTISTATFTVLGFDAETYDRGSLHDNATNNSRFTIPSGGAGLYLCSGYVLWAGNATGQRQLAILVNGSSIYGTSEVAGSVVFNAGNFVAFVVPLAVGDYVEFRAYQDSGGNLNTQSGQENIAGCVVRLTPT